MTSVVLLVVSLLLAPSPDDEAAAADVAAARALFLRNIAAIQARDRDGYLACYRQDERLVRVGASGSQLGFDGLAASTPANGADAWPDELMARDLSLQWLGDGLVHGTYRYRVSFAGDVRDGLSTRVFRRDPSGAWHIAVTSAVDTPAGTPAPPLALVGATLHAGDGGAPLENAVVVIREGRLLAVGPRASTPVPEGVEVVDLTGRHLVPGLVDTHVHYSQTGWADGRPDALDVREQYPYAQVATELERHPERLHRAFLASGVTAVFDVGGYPWTRRLAAATEDDPLAPHVVAAGPLLATWIPDELRLPDRSQFVLMEDEAGVRASVRSHASSGSQAIKVWFIVRGPADVEQGAVLLAAVADEARAVGLPLIVHATQLEAARAAVEAGAQLLVHSVDDAPVDDAFVEAARASGVFYCPTLTVGQGYEHMYAGAVPGHVEAQLASVHPDIAARVRRTAELTAGRGLSPERARRFSARQRRQEQVMAANLLTLHRAGVPVVAGTDAGNPLTLHGPSMVPELLAMQAAGLTPTEVLRAATRDAARALGRGDDLGLLEAGRVADLVVLTADPAQSVVNLASVVFVMRAGHLQSRAMLLPR